MGPIAARLRRPSMRRSTSTTVSAASRIAIAASSTGVSVPRTCMSYSQSVPQGTRRWYAATVPGVRSGAASVGATRGGEPPTACRAEQVLSNGWTQLAFIPREIEGSPTARRTSAAIRSPRPACAAAGRRGDLETGRSVSETRTNCPVPRHIVRLSRLDECGGWGHPVRRQKRG